MEEIINYIYKMRNDIIICISLFMVNALVMVYSNYLGCYKPTVDNIMNMNLICNGCITILYQINSITINIYMSIGVYFIKWLNNIIDNVIQPFKDNYTDNKVK